MTGRMAPVKHYDIVDRGGPRVWANARPDGASSSSATASTAHACSSEARDLVDGRYRRLSRTRPRGARAGARRRRRRAHDRIRRLAREGLSNSIMEYMALGLPVVCGDGGGNRELVEDGVTGFIAPAGRPGGSGRAPGVLARSPEARRAMGAAGRDRISRDFSRRDDGRAHARCLRGSDRRCQSRRVSDGPKSVCPRALRTAPNRPCSTLPAAPGLSFSPAI